MADAMQFELVSPERSLASLQARSVRIPAAEGDMTVMADHEPTITTLRPGLLLVEADGGAQEFAVTGGFAEVTANGVSVLAERALPRGDVTQEVFDTWIAEAGESARKARERAGGEAEEPGVADDTAKLLADMVAMGGHIGLDARQPNL